MTFYFIGCVLSVILFYLHSRLVEKKSGVRMLGNFSLGQVVFSYCTSFIVSWLGVCLVIFSMWDSKKKGLLWYFRLISLESLVKFEEDIERKFEKELNIEIL